MNSDKCQPHHTTKQNACNQICEFQYDILIYKVNQDTYWKVKCLIKEAGRIFFSASASRTIQKAISNINIKLESHFSLSSLGGRPLHLIRADRPILQMPLKIKPTIN